MSAGTQGDGLKLREGEHHKQDKALGALCLHRRYALHPLEMANVAYGSCSPNLLLSGREQSLLLRADSPSHPV